MSPTRPSPPAVLPEDPPGLADGQAQLGPWRLEGLLGRGASSRVYVALPQGDGRRRALKLQQGSDPGLADRMTREGQLQGQLRHEGLLAVEEVFDLEGRVCLVMPAIEGETLAAWVGAHHPLALPRARALLLGLLAGLEAVHRAGIVHRDLQPANVLVEAGTDRPLLCDFGIAKVLGEAIDPLQTHVGSPMGTPGYMAPEQWADASGVGIRADLFSFGALAVFVLTGQPPFSGPDPTSLLRATLEGRRLDLARLRPDCPPALVAAISACLSPDPRLRPASVAALREALRDAGPTRAGGVLDTLPPAPPAPVPPRRTRRLLAPLALLLAGGVGLALWMTRPAPGPVLEPAAPPAAPAADTGESVQPAAEPAPTPPAEAKAGLPCEGPKGELLGWWWAGPQLHRSWFFWAKVPQDTHVRAEPPGPDGRILAPVRCVLPAGSRVRVRGETVERDGQIWVPLHGGDLRPG